MSDTEFQMRRIITQNLAKNSLEMRRPSIMASELGHLERKESINTSPFKSKEETNAEMSPENTWVRNTRKGSVVATKEVGNLGLEIESIIEQEEEVNDISDIFMNYDHSRKKEICMMELKQTATQTINLELQISSFSIEVAKKYEEMDYFITESISYIKNPMISIETQTVEPIHTNIVIKRKTIELSTITEEMCNLVREIERESKAIETQAHFTQHSDQVLTINIPIKPTAALVEAISVGEVSLYNKRKKADLSFSQVELANIATKQKADYGTLAKLEIDSCTISTSNYSFTLRSGYEIENVIEQLNNMQDEEELKTTKSETQSTCEESVKQPFEDHNRKNHSTINIDPLKNFFFLVNIHN